MPKNLVGINYTYWTSSGFPMDFPKLIKYSAQVGAQVFEVNPTRLMALETDAQKGLKELLAQNGMKIAFNSGLSIQNDIASDDPNVRLKGIEDSKRILEFIAEFGGKFWSGINYSYWKRLPQPGKSREEKKRAYAYSVESMQKIVPTAESLGVCYAYEIVNRFEQFIFNTVEEAIQYCKDVGSPAAQFMIDVFHMGIEEDNLVEATRAAVKSGRLVHFHACEANRKLPGLGSSHVDWDGICNALKTDGYTGYVSLEPFMRMAAPSDCSAGIPVSDSCCIWRDFADSSEKSAIENAAVAVEFLKEKLK